MYNDCAGGVWVFLLQMLWEELYMASMGCLAV